MNRALRYWLTQSALLVSLVGAILLIVGFQATSTDLTLIVAKDNSIVALCAYNEAFISWAGTLPNDKHGMPICPHDRGRSHAIAGVVFENGACIPWGFALIILGTIGQMLLLEPPHRRDSN